MWRRKWSPRLGSSLLPVILESSDTLRRDCFGFGPFAHRHIDQSDTEAVWARQTVSTPLLFTSTPFQLASNLSTDKSVLVHLLIVTSTNPIRSLIEHGRLFSNGYNSDFLPLSSPPGFDRPLLRIISVTRCYVSKIGMRLRLYNIFLAFQRRFMMFRFFRLVIGSNFLLRKCFYCSFTAFHVYFLLI
jgi:hypothetical protein